MAILTGSILGKYELLRKVGRGGMSSVYKAVDVTNERVVAIKVLPPGLADEENFRARFQREARLLMGLRHPNIVPILDFGEDDEMYYIVMPFMNIGTLRDRLMGGPLRPEEGLRIIEQIAAALQFAHDNRIIHRDVKPSNILIDEKGNAWLSDFGTAYVSEATAQLTGSGLIGTPHYMAPEQARGESVTPKTDEYSLGVVLYQMCTGQLPFDAETPLGIAMKHANEPLPLPRYVNENLPEAIEGVLLKSLAKNPDDRYDSVTEMSRAFEEALQNVYDPTSGQLRPGARQPAPPTLHLKPVPDVIVSESEKDTTARGRWIALAVLSILLGVLAIWGASSVLTTRQTEQSLAATIDAFSGLQTSVAMGVSADLPENQLQTAVAATLEAMGVFANPPGGGNPLIPVDSVDGTNFPLSPENATATVQAATESMLAILGGSPTPSPSQTPNASATRTRTPTLSGTRTRTWTPSQTSSPTATRTPQPTASHTPSPTLVPSATWTNSPAPTVNPCTQISLSGPSPVSNIVRWTINNGTGSPITLTSIELSWPTIQNIALSEIDLGGNMIWIGDAFDSPTSIGSWIGGSSARRISGSASLEFFFANFAASGPYGLETTFDNGCTISD